VFYNSIDELKNAIDNTGTIIVLEKNTENIEKILKNPIITEAVSIDDIRDISAMATTKALKPLYFVFKNAEKLRPEAQNAALKLFEEPKENYHYVLQTTSPEALLTTIRSRAPIYAPLTVNTLEMPPEAEKEVFLLAKQLLVADLPKIIEIADEINKHKDTEKSPRRDYALNIIRTTIELAEKSYFKTENEAFTKKINGLIIAYKNISENGNIRLQLVANLV
jgi:hypothetical protein